MKDLVRKYIRKQINEMFLREAGEVDPIEDIKNTEKFIADKEKQLDADKKKETDMQKQWQNNQKVVSSQVGTLGDNISKEIKTKDAKKNSELYKADYLAKKENNKAEEEKLKMDKDQLALKKSAPTKTTSTAVPAASASQSSSSSSSSSSLAK